MSQATETARALAAMRPRVSGICLVCGRIMRGYATRRYCSVACKSRAYRERKNGKRTP